ncbi:MAG: HTTM domain-containing protein [Pirellulales bacterium]
MNIGAAIREYFEQVVAGWNRFWFRPQDPATLSFIRICAGLMLLYTHLVWSLDLEAFFGQGGWLPREVIATLQQSSYAWSYFWWIDSAWLLWTVHIAGLVVFAMLTVGYHSRIVAVLAYVIAVSYTGRVPGALFGLDKINCMLAMYLMLGPSGAYWSVDRLLARRRSRAPLPSPPPSVSANVAIRLIQLHMCIIYLFSGLGKLQGTAWWDGTAVWMALANLEYQSIDMTWLADWPKLVALMTHATVFWELFYVALVWHRLWRPIMLIGAVAVHGGIAIGLGMITFGLVMLIGNLAFIPPHMIRAAMDAIFARQGRESPVLEASTA